MTDQRKLVFRRLMHYSANNVLRTLSYLSYDRFVGLALKYSSDSYKVCAKYAALAKILSRPRLHVFGVLQPVFNNVEKSNAKYFSYKIKSILRASFS